jgi:signal transduction histidine kinase
LTQAEHEALRSFLFSDETRRIWLSEEGKRQAIRGVQKVVAEPRCAECHEQGAPLAIASMTVDLTTILGRIREHSRRNLALLIIAWAGLLGLTTAIVRRSAQRSARRLEAELEAAEAGADGENSTAELILDPAAAELHDSLRRLLQRQRKHRAEVASRLAHTDQLASLGRLAAGLAHEIKNPLAGIHGALEILRKDSDDPATSMLYDDMLEELKRVNHTLQLLLESARPRPPRLVPTDVATLVEEAVRLLRPGLRRQKIELSYEIASDLPPASIDGGKIRQVLINLIQNAAEAMEGEGSILVRAGGFPNRGDGVILAVEDDGPGISDESQRKIFEPFFTTKFTGTGLGLAIARSLVEQHGGSLQVESESGKGSTFYILLPEAAEADSDGEEAEGGD